MTADWQRIERLIGADNLDRLAKSHVGIIGLGSGGGFVAQSLAMSGIGHFTLIDPDILDEGNIVRHIADSRDVGRPKVEAVADLIRHRNNQAEVITIADKFESHLDALDGLDMVIVGVDNEPTKFAINEALLSRNIPAIYAGVYERGVGGDVVIIRPYDGPCYACWAQALRDEIAISEGQGGELDYGMIGESGTLEAEPGLWLHVLKVATIQADIVLNELLQGSPISEPLPGNTIIIANSSLEILEGYTNPPHSTLWVTIERDPECLVCGLKQQQASISLDELVSKDNGG